MKMGEADSVFTLVSKCFCLSFFLTHTIVWNGRFATILVSFILFEFFALASCTCFAVFFVFVALAQAVC